MRPLTFLSALLLLLPLATPALAHGGHADAPPGWTWDPSITVPLALALLLFGIGWWRLSRRSAGGGRWAKRGSLFLAGWLVLAGALLSPLHEAGERSFALHMTEHELLMLVAAPLLVLSHPLAVMLWAFPRRARRALGDFGASRPIAAAWHALTGPVTATVIQAVALWLWHAPSLFDLALADEGWHAAQHLSFFVSALLFWTAMLGRRGGLAGMPGARALAALCLFLTSIISGALGALMAFAPSPWYAGYAKLGLDAFGLTPAEDQQIAGLIMWVPGGLVHAVAALILAATLLRPEGLVRAR